jgi:hypothetical protein
MVGAERLLELTPTFSHARRCQRTQRCRAASFSTHALEGPSVRRGDRVGSLSHRVDHVFGMVGDAEEVEPLGHSLLEDGRRFDASTRLKSLSMS